MSLFTLRLAPISKSAARPFSIATPSCRALATPRLASRKTFPAPLHTSARLAMPTRRVTPAELLERNASYPEELWVSDRDRLESNKTGQNPSILWIGCSDSRVPESVVTRCKPGDIFVHRNIANQYNETDDSANSVLTFAVEVLGVQHIIIVGHTSCGGVKASLDCTQASQDLPSESMQRFLGPLFQLCRSFRESLGLKADQNPEDNEAFVQQMAEENVKDQVRKIIASKVVQANWQGKKSSFPGEPSDKVEVHGWIHEVSSGKLRDLGISKKAPA